MNSQSTMSIQQNKEITKNVNINFNNSKKIDSFDKRLENYIKKNEEKILNNLKQKKSLKTKKRIEKKELFVVHWNCNSVKNKIEELKLFIDKNRPDVISLNEIIV